MEANLPMRFSRIRNLVLLAAVLLGTVGASRALAQGPADVKGGSAVPIPQGVLGPRSTESIYYYRTYTHGNRVGLTVTNYGFFGTNLSDRQPSMEYPLGTGLDHLVRAGVWIGARTLSSGGDTTFKATTHVTTGCLDGYYSVTPGNAQGTEWTPSGNTVVERSSLRNSKVYNPQAVSEQDLLADFNDETVQSTTGLEPHVPLNIRARVEAYSWSFDLASSFVVLHVSLTNTGDQLRNVYVALYSQLVSNDKKAYSGWPPNSGTGPRPWFYSTQLDYVDSLKLLSEHFCAAPGHCLTEEVNPYWAGMKYLGSRTATTTARHHFKWWRWDPNSDQRRYDEQRYRLMADTLPAEATSNILLGTDSPVEMMTLGPFAVLERDSTVSMDFAFVGGRGLGELEANSKFAQLAFDLNYVLPTPPPSPRVHLVPRGNALDVYWDSSPEEVLDATSLHPDKHDFEGYRLYVGESSETLHMKFQADLRDSVPPNTGVEDWRLPEPVRFGDDTTAYRYRYHVEGLRDGYQYFVSMTSFDKGDARVPSLESGRTQNLATAFAGPQHAETVGRGVSVFPNPYRVEARWDARRLARDHYLWFVGLPARARVRIYSLGGDLVKSFDFDSSTYRGQGARGVYDATSSGGLDAPTLSGSMAAWDLISDQDQSVATGLYLYSVEDLATGKRSVGRFAVLKSDRETGY
jgi:hypothetical protein